MKMVSDTNFGCMKLIIAKYVQSKLVSDTIFINFTKAV